MEFKKVFKGIDSLYVSYKGTLKEGLKERREEKKRHTNVDRQDVKSVESLYPTCG